MAVLVQREHSDALGIYSRKVDTKPGWCIRTAVILWIKSECGCMAVAVQDIPTMLKLAPP